jgi:large subunit ribosomal protein L18
MKLDKRRRRENRTNYKRRLILLKSRAPRLVARKSNRYVILQIVESVNAQDRVIYSASTKELLKYGWPKANEGSLKSVSASYLGGLLLGKKARELKEKVILDIGLIPNTAGSRVYAALKGAADSGLNIDYDKKILPSEERVKGENGKVKEETLNKIKENLNK